MIKKNLKFKYSNAFNDFQEDRQRTVNLINYYENYGAF